MSNRYYRIGIVVGADAGNGDTPQARGLARRGVVTHFQASTPLFGYAEYADATKPHEEIATADQSALDDWYGAIVDKPGLSYVATYDAKGAIENEYVPVSTSASAPTAPLPQTGARGRAVNAASLLLSVAQHPAFAGYAERGPGLVDSERFDDEASARAWLNGLHADDRVTYGAIFSAAKPADPLIEYLGTIVVESDAPKLPKLSGTTPTRSSKPSSAGKIAGGIGLAGLAFIVLEKVKQR